MSYKSEFTDVYNYLSDCCKDPIFFTTSEAFKSDFYWKDDDPSTCVIIKYNGSASTVKVPKGVVEIGSRNSDGDYDFESDPNGLSGCFEHCEVTEVILPIGVKIIGGSAFYDCKSLTSIDIPNSVTSIGYCGFNGCESLQFIDIPNSVTEIGDGAFGFCKNLKSIIIPNSVKSIGENVFLNCRSLNSIVIPDGVTSIGKKAFCDCESLESITIPNSVTSIGKSAFLNCTNLGKIYYSGPLDLEVDRLRYGISVGCEIIRFVRF